MHLYTCVHMHTHTFILIIKFATLWIKSAQYHWKSIYNEKKFQQSHLKTNNSKTNKDENKYMNNNDNNITYYIKVTVIPTVISVLGTVPKGLVKELEELEIRTQVETIQMTALSRLARIPRRVLETCCHSNNNNNNNNSSSSSSCSSSSSWNKNTRK